MFNSDRFNLGKRYYGPPSPFSSSWCAARLVSQNTLKSASDNIAYFFYVADSPNQYTLTMMIVFLASPSDPTVWHHVVRFSRSFLLDESNPGFQQRSVTTALEPMEVVSLVPVGLSPSHQILTQSYANSNKRIGSNYIIAAPSYQTRMEVLVTECIGLGSSALVHSV